MSHLMASVGNLPGYEATYEPVGTGSMVVYHGRTGHMRQGRTAFPAIVFSQNKDDGSLELLVLFEPEDQIWERRVLPRTETNPGHSWSPVEAFPIHGISVDAEAIEALTSALERERAKIEENMRHMTTALSAIGQLREKIFGEWQEPPKAVMDHLADFDGQLAEHDGRLKLIEAKLGLTEGK